MIKHLSFFRILFIMALLFSFKVGIKAQFAGGSGTKDDPWQISTVTQLDSVRNYLDSNFVLLNDLDFSTSIYNSSKSDTGWNPIKSFKGSFNGKGYSINNLYVNRPSQNSVGLFGGITGGASIDSINILNANVIGAGNSGVLVGSVTGSSIITNCYSDGTVKSVKNYNTGGLIGYVSYGTITGCSSQSSVYNVGYHAGGLAGYVEYATVSLCYANSTVFSEYITSGGLIGQLNYSTIKDCYATGNVYGSQTNGGVLGSAVSSTISNCYSSCYLEGVGLHGVSGYRRDGSLKNCYFNNDVTEGSTNYGGTALTTEQMKDQSNFNSWDFTSTWTTNSGKTFPVFQNYNCLPIFIQDLNQTIKQNQAFTDTIKIISEDDNISFSLQDAPEGMSIINDSIISWTPTVCGQYYFWIIATNSDNNTAKTYVKINVHNFDNEGTEEDPFEIYSIDDLNNVRFFLSSSFILMNDIDFTDYDYSKINSTSGWNPIAPSYYVCFKGNFNGKGHTISNFYINSDNDFKGLFGGCKNATIDSLDINNCSIKGEGYCIGGLVGFIEGTNVTNCNTSGYIEGEYYLGGLVGFADESNITNCSANVNAISSSDMAGGLVGELYKTVVSKCYASGNIEGEYYLGGLIGYSSGSDSISNSFATGNVSATSSNNSYAGGFVGGLSSSKTFNCYSTGMVSGKNKSLGGFVGYLTSGSTVSDCFNIGCVSGISATGGFLGLSNSNNDTILDCYFDTITTGLSVSVGQSNKGLFAYGNNTQKLMQSSTFVDWNFDTVWAITENSTYPALQKLNNAPVAIPKNKIGSWNLIFRSNYDYETQKTNLVYKYDSVQSLITGTDYINSLSEIANNDSLVISYRIGEYSNELSDTLWGNSVVSYLVYSNNAPVITSLAPTTGVLNKEYTYTVIATDEDEDELTYSISNAPDGMIITNNVISWTPSGSITSSGDVTVTVSDGALTDSETFSIEIASSDINENNISGFNMQPNPSSGYINISLNQAVDNANLIVFSLTGKIVYEDESFTGGAINLSDIKSGIYIVYLNTEKEIFTKKLVIR